MRITHEEFKTVLIRCLQKTGTSEEEAQILLEMIKVNRTTQAVITELWLQKIPDDVDTEILRSQVCHRDKHGHFNTD